MHLNNRYRFRPCLERLETRDTPSSFGGFNFSIPTPVLPPALVAQAQAQSLGDRMAAYLQSKVGQRVGGGECANMATEALRVAGANFINGQVGNNPNDYSWGTQVARLTNGSQLAGKVFKVGDIIQFTDAAFSNRGTIHQHTQVVAAVDSKGRITEVYEQNVGKLSGHPGDGRYVHRDPALDLSKLTGGSVTIYRAQPRTTQAGHFDFTIVNNTNTAQSVQMYFGSSKVGGPATLTSQNTAGSYETMSAWTSGGGKLTVVVGGKSIAIDNGGGYEIYTAANGQLGLRKL